jgi:hypothetical protein
MGRGRGTASDGLRAVGPASAGGGEGRRSGEGGETPAGATLRQLVEGSRGSTCHRREGASVLLGLIGRAMKVLARFRSGEARADLDHVGDELVRLDRRPAQAPATSR